MQGFKVFGNNIVLLRPKVALHASIDAPKELLDPALKLFEGLQEWDITIGSAWHSPLEAALVKRYSQLSEAYLAYFLDSRMSDFKIPANLEMPYHNRRVVFVEPSAPKSQLESEGASIRDEIIDELFEQHIFLFIRQGGIMEQRFAHLLHQGKRVTILKHPVNDPYLIGDTEPIERYSIEKLFA